jgi:hypothetical protein
MAVVWSWAFGSEGKSPMETYLGFEYINGGGTQAPFTGADNVYSYASYPGTKYSWGTSALRGFRFPAAVAAPGAGRVAAAIKAKTTWYSNTSSPLLKTEGVNDPADMLAYMYISSSITGAVACYVDNTLVGTTSLTLDDWHYVAISYDFGVTTPNSATATFFVNGTQVATGSDSSGPTGTETQVRITSGGFSNTLGLVAQCISYDTGTSEADAAAPIFVSRLEPNADTSTVGVWSPSTGATNIGVTAGAYNNATYTQEATPSSGDNVVTEVNNLATQLGVVSSSVVSATGHSYSTGTGVTAFCSARDSGSSYSDGDAVTPDASDVTYAYASANTGLTGSSTINVKYEIV